MNVCACACACVLCISYMPVRVLSAWCVHYVLCACVGVHVILCLYIIHLSPQSTVAVFG
jgi:hypothetical protein